MGWWDICCSAAVLALTLLHLLPFESRRDRVGVGLSQLARPQKVGCVHRMEVDLALWTLEYANGVFLLLLAGCVFTATPTERGVFFDTPEIRDGVAIIRFDGPHKMNTISFELQDEAKALWQVSTTALLTQ